ncbi:acyl-CoA N-acyltransferase [Boeremia exigua]|uniref:acyl-CoA N-acyltransferase n=1 Tax=Boeremia exigua TaxID=749465 RepID=UPI001E8E40C5|nr:acyl-CoA N-acyltransferase [Boeremia exigua]KAH6643725.1 acyl-CoA N-acyltransferase [Boeremia exigua]
MDSPSGTPQPTAMLDPTFHITAPRLHLSYLDPTNDAHMAFAVHLYSSPEMLAVAAQTGASVAKPQTISDARAALLPAMQRLATTGRGRYIISLRNPDVAFVDEQDREFIGIVSMQQQRYPARPCPALPDLGFGLLAKYYGKGYAGEACGALMQHFRETKGCARFAGFTHPENVQSQKLFRSLGFEDRGVMDVAGIVGKEGDAARVSVWVKGAAPEVDLGELGIGPGSEGRGE